MQKVLFITILVALASFTNAASTPTVNLVVTYPNGHGQFQYGDAVTYTTSVAPVGTGTTTPPTGTVNVFADGAQRATCQLLSSPPTNIVCAVNETATPPLTVGPHNFTSFYLGDQNYNAANSGVQTLTVVAVPTITISVNPSNPTVAQAVTVTIATTATNPPNQASQPTGTVTFTANGNQLGTCTLTSGGCTFTIPANTLTQGSVTLVGGYGGDQTFAPVNVSTTFTVGVATTATTASSTSTTATTASSTSTTASTVATATTASSANNGATASTATTTGSDTNGAAATATTASTTGATTQTGASTQLNNGGSTAFTGTTSGAVAVCGSIFLTLLAAAVAL